MFKNLVIKISGEALSGKTGNYYDEKTVGCFLSQINKAREMGVRCSIVVGGGNIWRGKDDESDIKKAASHQIGMLASVMNGLFLAQKAAGYGMRAIVATPFEIGTMTELFNRERICQYLKEGVLPIFAGGTGHPFFSTDTIVAVRGAEIGADGLVFTKEYRKRDKDGNIFSGVYTKDPCTSADAQKINELSFSEYLKGGYTVVDMAAAAICAGNDVDVTGLCINAETQDAILLAACADVSEGRQRFINHGTIITK